MLAFILFTTLIAGLFTYLIIGYIEKKGEFDPSLLRKLIFAAIAAALTFIAGYLANEFTNIMIGSM
jgi:hypothetical protein